MNVLVLNVGSATLKFQLVETDADRMAKNTDRKLALGHVERIGGEAVFRLVDGEGRVQRGAAAIRDHRAAVQFILQWLVGDGDGGDDGASAFAGAAAVPEPAGVVDSVADIQAVGHRVVHGGERFRRSVLIDDDVVKGLEEMIDLAPLHNPHNLRGIAAVRQALGPGVPQVAVFDTAFHHTLPDRAYLYALPYQYYRRHRVRRYGFHGTSYRWVAHRYRQLTGRSREETNIVALHLGNGCSACAIRAGESIDTSMGFTPLEGLVMGTRSGDLDPAILDHVAAKEGFSLPELDNVLNKQSGLLGISGLTNDMRELLEEAEENDDRRAWLAIEVFAYRVRKYIGAYLAAVDGADAVVFAGGIGENAPSIRNLVCGGLGALGIQLDDAANRQAVGGAEGKISADDSGVEVWVVPTDEELLIARDTVRVITGMDTRY